ncbi:C40 family peptidase [Sediminispirochaeta smaragdinae]|jgi:hypothetical protein|uniref:NLP/P60 protein n=1 Tax=Sediminispirochaeta smaragdinae (strain DSM 11293 / JCM 15392 / SEBR 4228) TaxID=573413 RepID=E1R3N2_SEDSS|nr:NlpC/P60 family protein [Sediminispirochaeta smaragdinae]ADK82003.1 NLP/P60 protein [Sediminispirochaeta smaragdinae DSM 11293]
MDRSRHIMVVVGLLIFAVIMIIIDYLVPIEITSDAPAEIRRAAVEQGLPLIGTPYRFGAKGPVAFDCSGLIVYLYTKAVEASEFKLPFEDAHAQELAHQYSSPVSDPMPGDLAFFQSETGKITHVALIIAVSEQEFLLLEASGYTNSVEKRNVEKNRSDLFSVARLRLVKHY